jgi:hypothetical protein
MPKRHFPGISYRVSAYASRFLTQDRESFTMPPHIILASHQRLYAWLLLNAIKNASAVPIKVAKAGSTRTPALTLCLHNK